jgi:hypothetical protein
MEEGLRCKGIAGVVGEATHLSLNTSGGFSSAPESPASHRWSSGAGAMRARKSMPQSPMLPRHVGGSRPLPLFLARSMSFNASIGMSNCCASGVVSRIHGFAAEYRQYRPDYQRASSSSISFHSYSAAEGECCWQEAVSQEGTVFKF